MGQFTRFTNKLATSLCGGSTQKLIAGWWYCILVGTLTLTLMSFWIISTRSVSEAFAATCAAGMLVAVSVGGTMIMRKFHNSIAVGFFIGGVVAVSQLFFLLFFIYVGYAGDRHYNGLTSGQESLMAFLCLVESFLLTTFAAILGAHRSQVLDREQFHGGSTAGGNESVGDSDTYAPPGGIIS